jgi:adenosylhomocysteine nucleosidase
VTCLIACGLVREARLLTGAGLIPVAGGGDPLRLELALERHIAEFAGTFSALLSCGIAGALDPALNVGAIIVDAPDDFPVPPGARRGAIAGQDQIAATIAQKAALFAATGACAVDMETHIARWVAARHALPFAAIRVISDSAAHTLPPAALIGMAPDGTMALRAVLNSLARDPSQLPALIRTGRNAQVAFVRLRLVRDAAAQAAGRV